MSEGVTKVIYLSITIIFLVAIIGILTSGAVSAKDIGEKGTSYFEKGIRTEPINTYKLTDGSKPIAAIAAVIRRMKENISSFHCAFCGETSDGDDVGACLRNHLSGRGVLTFTQDTEGTYSVTLSEG